MAILASQGGLVAVTGGSGFIGRRLVGRLLERGYRGVRVLDRRPPAARAAVASRIVDLAEASSGELDAALSSVTHLIHLAAVKHSSHADPEAIRRVNVDGSRRLFESANRNGIRRIVFASSLYAYGRDRGGPLTEHETPLPTTAYGESKLEGERLGFALSASGGPEFVALRYFFVYGPGQADEGERPSFIAGTLARLRRGEAPVIHGDGEQALDYVFIDDVVDATLAALDASVTGETLNVGTGEAVSVNELVAKMQRAAGTAFTPERTEADDSAGTLRVAATERAERLLGFRAGTSIEEGIRRIFRIL